jgi:hypothetical protein
MKNEKRTTGTEEEGFEPSAKPQQKPLFPPNLIDAWPTLPEAIRAGILAMIRAASG